MGNTVLIIDDSDTVRAHVKESLAPTGIFDEFLEAGNGMEGFKMLVNHSVDLVLCDVIMPGTDGFRFLNLKGSQSEFAEIPVLMLTGQGGVENKVKTLGAGASDYITKPFHAEELIARVKVHVKLKNLQDEMKEKNKRLEELTRTDPLTGLWNRRYFMERFNSEYSRARRHQIPLTYVMLDLDHFKKVNDHYGHVAGDEALILTAKLLQDSLREHDACGRYGGEEFSMLLPETDPQGAFSVADRCRQSVADAELVVEGQKISLSISMGISTLWPGSEWSVSDVIRYADGALYRSKENGRNRVTICNPDPDFDPEAEPE